MKTRMLLWWLPVVMMALLAVDAWPLGREMTSPVTEKTFVMHPIGVVQKSNDRVRIVLEEKYYRVCWGWTGFRTFKCCGGLIRMTRRRSGRSCRCIPGATCRIRSPVCLRLARRFART